MNFTPSYQDSPLGQDCVEKELKDEVPNLSQNNTKSTEEKKTSLDWSENGLTSLDSLHLFPDLLSLNLSNNQIKVISSEIKTW